MILIVTETRFYTKYFPLFYIMNEVGVCKIYAEY